MKNGNKIQFPFTELNCYSFVGLPIFEVRLTDWRQSKGIAKRDETKKNSNKISYTKNRLKIFIEYNIPTHIAYIVY